MSTAAFFTAAFESALEHQVATHGDLLRHATPDVLAGHLPRPVWVRILGACLAAPRLDATVVIDAIGVATLCEHVPAPVLWACLSEIAQRALDRGLVAAPPAMASSAAAVDVSPAGGPGQSTGRNGGSSRRPATADGGGVVAPASGPVGSAPARHASDPADEVTRASAPIDPARLAAGAAGAERTASGRGEPDPLGEPPALPRAPGATTRASSSTITRRPQASTGAPPAATPAPPSKAPRGTPPPSPRRSVSAAEFEIETDVNEQWKRAGTSAPAELAVDDEQLIDWTSSDEPATAAPGSDQGSRKSR